MCVWKCIANNKTVLLTIVLAYLVGLGLAIDWDVKLSGDWVWNVSFSTQLETDDSAWDVVSAIGAILAGLGTVCLFGFGLVKSKEWKTQILLKDKREALFGWYLEALTYIDSVSSELATRLSKYRVYARSNENCLSELAEARRTNNIDEESKLTQKQKDLASYTRSLMADCVRAENTLSGVREKLNRTGKLLLVNFPAEKNLANQITSAVDYSLNSDGERYVLRDFLKDPKLLRQNIDRMKVDIDEVLEKLKSEIQ